MNNHHILPDIPEEEVEEIEASLHRKYLIFFAKLILMIGVFWLVFNKINIDELKEHLQNIPIYYIIMAVIFLNSAQIISGFRMRYYYKSIDTKFDKIFSVAVYYVGAFYSIILPGGISGDGYRAYLLKKLYKINIKTSLRIVICERANGLFLLCFLAFVYAIIGEAKNHIEFGSVLIISGLAILIPGYFISAKIILKDPPKIALGASFYSLGSQLCVSACAASILLGIGVEFSNLADYLVIFMISSVISILPISIGSAGVREVTFLYCIQFLVSQNFTDLDAEIGVAAALAYFGVHVLTSMVGLIFIHRLDKLSKKDCARRGL